MPNSYSKQLSDRDTDASVGRAGNITHLFMLSPSLSLSISIIISIIFDANNNAPSVGKEKNKKVHE